MPGQPTPPNVHPQKSGLVMGVINHWFPLIGPAMKPLFLGAYVGEVGWLAMIIAVSSWLSVAQLGAGGCPQKSFFWLVFFFSKNFPTYPWNVPQTPNQRFMKEFLSFGGFSGFLGYAPRVCWSVLRFFPPIWKICDSQKSKNGFIFPRFSGWT